MTKLGALLNSKEMQSRIVAILNAEEKKYTPTCKAVEVIKPDNITVFEEPQWRKEALTDGTWVVRFAIKACETTGMRSILFRKQDAGVEMISMVPGTTITDPALQIDVARSFFMSAVREFPECKTPFIRETILNAPPKTVEGTWEEIWMADLCGKRVGQLIKFVPTEDGTAFGLQLVE